MTDVTNTADSGAGELSPAIEPKNDTQAAAAEAAKPETDTADEAAKAEAAKADEAKKQDEEKKRNRTRDYIKSLQQREAEAREQARLMQERLDALERRVAPTQPDREPRLEDFDYDMDAWQQAHTKYVAAQVRKELAEESQRTAAQREQQELIGSYAERVADFAEAHEDFHEVVNSIKYVPHDQVQLAIMAHPRGHEIAYYLGQNEDEAFNLAAVSPHLATAAVERLVARMGAAPAAKQPTAPPPAAPAKPITQAPPPPPTVGGRSPTEVPPEKLTDDEWYARERERRRKR